MAYEQKPNSGSLFPNDRKEKDTHPDLTGTIDVDGVAYWINGWSKTANSGKQFISLSVRLKDKQPGAANTSSLAKWSQPTASSAPQQARSPQPSLNLVNSSDQAIDEEVPF
tara:strand:- start:2607 stop:2939 length:333 start_codon:yes stop_codon:yes gene_type:complete